MEPFWPSSFSLLHEESGGTAAFIGAVIGEAAVVCCAVFTNPAWLWWNVIGCVVGVAAALVVQALSPQVNAAATPQ